MTALAINGGEAVTERSVPYHRPTVGQPEIEAAGESIDSQYIVGPGPYCEKVESHLEQEWEIPRVLTTTSCTHALELGLLTADLPDGAEVIVPSFTYVSSAQAVLRAGATPVFADVDPQTMTLTPDTIEPHRTDNTRAVMMVHYGGFPGPVTDVVDYCEEHDLFCIEDAAQVYDTSINDQQAGTIGRFGAISFHGTKSITCGEGGVLLINDESDVERAEMIRDKGTDRSVSRLGDVDRYTWRSIGSSYVLSDILGAVLWSQIQRWEEIKQTRREIQEQVRTGIRELDDRDTFDLIEPPDDVEENGHITGFLIPWPEDRDWFLKALQAEGIEAHEHYRPLHQSPYARNNLDPPESLPASERVSDSLVRVPAHPDLSERQVNQVIEALEKLYPHLPRE